MIRLTPDLVCWYQVLPLGPEKCRMVGQVLALDDERREMRAARYLNLRINRRVAAEDMALCRAVDAGVRSSGYRGGYLSDLESGVRAHQARIRTLLPISRRSAAPAPGTLAALNTEMLAHGALEADAAANLGPDRAGIPDLAR